MKLAGRRVLVMGLGRSGRAAARLAARHGARVAVSDAGRSPALEAVVRELAPSLARHELGDHSPELIAWADLIVASPGVPLALPIFAGARANGVEIIGEVELAYRLFDAPVIGITGTKGKSTTTALAGEILQLAGKRVFIGGNLGTPFAEALLEGETPDLAVLELSSFQLETITELRPACAALLNFAPDHQDRYRAFADYVEAKLRLFMNQTPADAAVLNGADPLVVQHAAGLRARMFTFNRRDGHAWCEGDRLHLHTPAVTAQLDLRAFAPPGEHNRENLAAAALIAALSGASADAIAQAMAAFRGLPHRLEDLGEIDGVLYLNDSKATTPGAVRTTLRAVRRPVVLILGGRDKGGEWSSIRDDVAGARAVLAYGEAAERIAAGLAPVPVRVIGPFREALEAARASAKRGDAVLLSPGCASFDQFANFEARGEAMREWVKSR